MTTPTLSDFLRDARLARGSTLRKVASLVGIDFTYLSKVETGSDEPSDALVRRLGQALGFDPDPLLLRRAIGRVPADVRLAIEREARETLAVSLRALHDYDPPHARCDPCAALAAYREAGR